MCRFCSPACGRSGVDPAGAKPRSGDNVKLAKNCGELALAIAALQWAYLLMMLGYEKWGFLGGALGLISSPALYPFSPFTAWLFFPADQLVWFYGLLGLAVLCGIVVYMLTPKITSDYPYR